MTPESLHIYPNDTLRDGQRVAYGGSDRIDVSRAEYERLVESLAVVEIPAFEGERSCFTCYWATGNNCRMAGFNTKPYEDAAGLDDNLMPIDRTVKCPGWKPKETPHV